MRDYHIISADSPRVEPPDLWEKWLEKKYQDTAPKLVDDGDGGHAWLYMGAQRPEPLGLVTCVGTRPEQLKWTGEQYGVEPPSRPATTGRRGSKILDVDGVDAEMLYPPQRAMLTFMKNKDVGRASRRHPRLQPLAQGRLLRADPDRLIAIFQIPNVGIDGPRSRAASRAKKEGFRGVAISAWPSGASYSRARTIRSGTRRAARHAGQHPHHARRAADEVAALEGGRRGDSATGRSRTRCR
jgi:hypothetical protein